MKQVYIEGMIPNELYAAVLRKVEDDTTLEEAHAIALKEEDSMIRVKRKENFLNTNNNITNNKFNDNNSFKNNNKNYQNNNNNSKNFQKEKISMSPEGLCLFCGQKHDSKECYSGKFRFYSIKEAQILTTANLTPFKRTERPTHRITEDTPFIKKAMEKISQNSKKV